MRVLHTVDVFLKVSQNWIYPQVVDVPGVDSRVLCNRRQNADAFPLARRNLLLSSPQGPLARSASHLNTLAMWVGWGENQAGGRVGRWRPSIVHAHYGTHAWEGIGLAASLGAPLVVSFYGCDAWRMPDTTSGWSKRYEQLFSAGRLFLVGGPVMRNRLLELGCPPTKIRIHQRGVDLQKLQFRDRTPSRQLAVAMVGQFVEKKGLANGLMACAEARSRGVDLRVTIVGGEEVDEPGSPQIAAELEAIARQPLLRGRVTFAGRLSLEQTRALLDAHDVYLCPSKRALSGDAEGGSPAALTEAMALGLCCIGTRHCDIPEVVVDGETGLLCDEDDVQGLARALCALADHRSRAQAMAVRGRRHIEDHFSLHRQLEGLGEIYGRLQKADVTADADARGQARRAATQAASRGRALGYR